MKVYAHAYPNKDEAKKNRPPEAVTIELSEYVKTLVLEVVKDAAIVKDNVVKRRY